MQTLYMEKKEIKILFVFDEDEHIPRTISLPQSLNNYRVRYTITTLPSKKAYGYGFHVVLFSRNVELEQIVRFEQEYGKNYHVISYFPAFTKRTRREEVDIIIQNCLPYVDEFQRSGMNFKKFLQKFNEQNP